tara:strand:+ start:319 stop:501 length:183 start_codon:yes stop_codon:yes gene_type:complete
MIAIQAKKAIFLAILFNDTDCCLSSSRTLSLIVSLLYSTYHSILSDPLKSFGIEAGYSSV